MEHADSFIDPHLNIGAVLIIIAQIIMAVAFIYSLRQSIAVLQTRFDVVDKRMDKLEQAAERQTEILVSLGEQKIRQDNLERDNVRMQDLMQGMVERMGQIEMSNRLGVSIGGLKRNPT